MTASRHIKIEAQKWDRCSRSGSLKIGTKRIPLHTYSPLITSESDQRAYVESRTIYPSETDHAGMMAFRTFDLEGSLGAMRKSLGQETLGGSAGSLSRKDIIDATPMIIDPCTEYTRYTFHRDDLINDPNTAPELKNLARKTDIAMSRNKRKSPSSTDSSENDKHDRIWQEFSRDDSALSSAVSETLAVQQKWGADVMLPPVPPADNVAMLAISEKINRVSQAVSQGHSCANYNILTHGFLRRSSHIDALLDYLASLDTTFNVLKFKNNWLEQVPNYGHRIQLKRLLEGINEMKLTNPDRVFMLLEPGYASYAAAAGGFDIVSASLRALDRDGRGFSPRAGGRGGYFAPKQMIVLQWDIVEEMLKKNGLPCSCEICRRINSIPSPKVWNLQRRSHYIHCTSRLYGELTRLVDEQKMEMAIQRLSQSEISNFAHVLPYIHG